MKTYITLFLSLCPLLGFCQLNLTLKRELDSMFVLDQRYRGYLSELTKNQALADSLMNVFEIKTDLSSVLWKYQNRIDSSNLMRIEEIIDRYGYPGSSLVGEPANEVAFYIIQHSPKIQTYFPLVKKAAQTNQVPLNLSAMMEDRLLTEHLKPQIYGTQVAYYPLRADFSKQEWFIWPISDPLGVNERRAKAGFTQSVEDNAKRMGVEYKVMTIKEAKSRYSLSND